MTVGADARALVAVAMTIGLAACPGGDGSDGGRPDGAATASTCPPESMLDYATFGEPFFETYCQRCHASTVTGTARMGAPATVTFDDVMMIRARSEDIDRAAAAGPNAINTAMPDRDPTPPIEDRYRLGEWLACGAP